MGGCKSCAKLLVMQMRIISNKLAFNYIKYYVLTNKLPFPWPTFTPLLLKGAKNPCARAKRVIEGKTDREGHFLSSAHNLAMCT